MATAAKAIAGLGGLLATATVPSAYLAISSSSSNNEETNKVGNRKTGTEWLSSRGHTPNKPTFKNQDSLSHGCAENLFSDNKETPDPATDAKIYGCAVMSMDLGKTGILFSGNIDPKYIKFNSEIAIRKGSEGWVINSRVDNWSSYTTYFNYLLTTYKYEQGKWKKEGESRLWKDPSTEDGNPKSISSEEDSTKDINIQDKLLVIKVPEHTWFNDSRWVYPNSNTRTKDKIPTETKKWSGVWINDEKVGSWIFEGIELYMVKKQYSQIFCKGETNDCFQKNNAAGSPKTEKTNNAETWTKAHQESTQNNEKIQDMIEGTVKGIIEKLKDSKGSWKKLEDICEAKVDETPDEEQKNQLRMYCSKGKKSN